VHESIKVKQYLVKAKRPWAETTVVFVVRQRRGDRDGQELSLYKMLFHFKSSIVGVHHPFTPPPHLQSLPYCNTNARPLRNKRLIPDPPLVSHTPYNVGRDYPVKVNQEPTPPLYDSGRRLSQGAALESGRRVRREAPRGALGRRLLKIPPGIFLLRRVRLGSTRV